MLIEALQQLSMWIAAADIGLLELRGPGVLLRLGRDAADGTTVGERNAAMPTPSPGPAGAVVVNAPAAGVFLHTHPMQATPLAPAGARVQAGTPIGLLQVGALLLPVPAPRAGVVKGVRVAQGTLVGYGTPLVDLDPEPDSN